MTKQTTVSSIQEWFTRQVDPGWFEQPLEILEDTDEILVIGTLPAPSDAGASATADAGTAEEAAGSGGPGSEASDGASEGAASAPHGESGGPKVREAAAIAAFRQATRERRISIAREAEHLFGRSISWGARCGGTRSLFTTLSVPVMTRLRLTEREVLDTLVESGVARSRSDALAWCVRLVAEHESDWLGELREALVGVRRVRAEGPRSL